MFYVGQKVVCVDGKKTNKYTPWPVRPGVTLDGLKEGAVYTIRMVGSYAGIPTIWLNEIVRPIMDGWESFGEQAYSVHRFRPAVEHKTDISIFTKMLDGELVR